MVTASLVTALAIVVRRVKAAVAWQAEGVCGSVDSWHYLCSRRGYNHGCAQQVQDLGETLYPDGVFGLDRSISYVLRAARCVR
jgi:hypothetical protein